MFKAFFYDAAGKPRHICLAWQTCNNLLLFHLFHWFMPHVFMLHFFVNRGILVGSAGS
jgi:hypothetical protein